ncbi:MAG: LysR family transcriptional regulator [Oscillospiraceae bacterium]|jgi:DNA-binding transcriptional LysR family regulator|nr:LysR family transcriptional regulator [Oscillospiraceae bacterium]
MYNITFQQIETFLTVARYLNLSRAAKAMFVSQPAMSKTLRRFEDGLGLELFSRSNQGVTLTRAGESLHASLVPLYDSVNRAIETARALTETAVSTLRVVAPSSYDAAGDFAPLKRHLAAYASRYADVTITESLCDFRALRDALRFGEADVVFAQSFAIAGLHGISYKEIAEFELCVAMSASHPLAAYDELQIAELSRETFYIVPTTGEPRDKTALLARCAALGFTPRRVEFVPNFQTLLHTIASSGMSLCGRFASGSEPLIKYYPTHSPESSGLELPRVVAAWQTDSVSTEARRFIDMLSGETHTVTEE